MWTSGLPTTRNDNLIPIGESHTFDNLLCASFRQAASFSQRNFQEQRSTGSWRFCVTWSDRLGSRECMSDTSRVWDRYSCVPNTRRTWWNQNLSQTHWMRGMYMTTIVFTYGPWGAWRGLYPDVFNVLLNPISLQDCACKETTYPKNDKYVWWSYYGVMIHDSRFKNVIFLLGQCWWQQYTTPSIVETWLEANRTSDILTTFSTTMYLNVMLSPSSGWHALVHATWKFKHVWVPEHNIW